MRFTPILIPNTPEGTPEKLNQLTELVVHAEELGFDGMWLTEHHGSIYGRPSPALILAHLAGHTKRIRIGTAVVVLPWHHPLDVASDLATLDVLSEGRLDVGFGKGLFPNEFDFFGIPAQEARSRFDESLEFITQAWSQESASLDGQHWKIPEIRFVPRTTQRPTPPIWLVALSPPTIESVVERRANGLIGPYLTPFDDIKERYFDVWNEKLSEAGLEHGVLELGHNQHVYVAETDEQAFEEATPHLRAYCDILGECLPPRESVRGTPYEHYADWKDTLQTLEGDALYKERAVVGSPERVIELIRKFEQAGVTTFIPFINFGTMPVDLAKKSLSLFAEKVMPAFQRDPVSA
jgi:alkanesulfonate monooxygenase SsuD/methylene tetrahydromethanopterin reductase-like flavin-dependent oxidoreductase (luciferase family)